MKKILAVYDNEGKTFDRYTVVLTHSYEPREDKNIYTSLGLSFNPSSPQGFSQFGDCILGNHLGKKITFSSLPKTIKGHIKGRL